MNRTDQLRAALDRAKDRAAYCRRQFEQFAAGADTTQPDEQRRHRKLRSDWERAEADAAHARLQLERALDLNRHAAGMEL